MAKRNSRAGDPCNNSSCRFQCTEYDAQGKDWGLGGSFGGHFGYCCYYCRNSSFATNSAQDNNHGPRCKRELNANVANISTITSKINTAFTTILNKSFVPSNIDKTPATHYTYASLDDVFDPTLQHTNVDVLTSLSTIANNFTTVYNTAIPYAKSQVDIDTETAKATALLINPSISSQVTGAGLFTQAQKEAAVTFATSGLINPNDSDAVTRANLFTQAQKAAAVTAQLDADLLVLNTTVVNAMKSLAAASITRAVVDLQSFTQGFSMDTTSNTYDLETILMSVYLNDMAKIVREMVDAVSIRGTLADVISAVNGIYITIWTTNITGANSSGQDMVNSMRGAMNDLRELVRKPDTTKESILGDIDVLILQNIVTWIDHVRHPVSFVQSI